MSQFDDNFRSAFEDNSSVNSGGSYGGLSISEILQQPHLAEQYGLYGVGSNSEDYMLNSENVSSKEIDVRTLLYFVGAQAIGVGLILGFTFLP
jgi:hypothetical protein